MSSRYGWFLAVRMLFPMGVVGTDGPALTTQQQEVLKATTKLAPEVREYVKLDDAVIALSHICVIDGTGQPARDDQTLIIRDGAIAAIGDAISTPIPPGGEGARPPGSFRYARSGRA